MKLFGKKKYPAHLFNDLSFSKQALIFGWELFKVVVISLAIIVPVRYFLIKPFYVKGASMEPNFHDHEYLIIDEISYRFGQPQRGDIVVFKDPFDSGQYFIKRIIGLPKERIRVSGGNVYVYNEKNPQGAVLEEPYLLPGLKTIGEIELTLADGEYYVLGDNRMASLDSRAFGPMKEDSFVGRVLWRGWPVNKVGFIINNIEYNL